MLRRLSGLMTGTDGAASRSGWQDLLAWPEAVDRDGNLRQRARARQVRSHADADARAAEARLRDVERPAPAVPTGAVWARRPSFWHHPVAEPVHIGPPNGRAIADDLTLFHDCPKAEMILRQSLARDTAPAPFALTLDTLHFEGSFLSLVTALPDTEAASLGSRDVLRIDLALTASAVTRLYGRLNLKQGPNTAQMVAELSAPEAGRSQAAFDLAYGGLRNQPVEHAWIDLIVERPAMLRLTLQDMILSRSSRAEL